MIHDMETEIRELTEKQQIEMDFKLQQLDHTLTSEVNRFYHKNTTR